MEVSEKILKKAARVEHLVLDVDGVLTDGRIVYTTGGEQVLAFHVHDGLGIRLLLENDIGVSIITARASAALERRVGELGIENLIQGCKDKAEAFSRVCSLAGVRPESVSAVGDDLMDLPMLRLAGLAVAVADAQPAILPYADFITSRPGGGGAVREVCELILRSKGLYEAAVARFTGLEPEVPSP